MSNRSVVLSVVLPAYNEGHCIVENVTKIIKAIQGIGVDYEIIIVNDGSTDDTLAKINSIEDPRITVISYVPNKGKGYAVKKGMLAACGHYRLFMDIDLATSLDSIGKFFQLIETQTADLIIGDRKSAPDRLSIPQPFIRKFFSAGFIKLSQLICNSQTHDFTCGFKMFTRKASNELFNRQCLNGWVFDTEILFIARKHNLRIMEHPVTWQHRSNSKVRLLRHVLSSMVELLEISCNNIRGRYA